MNMGDRLVKCSFSHCLCPNEDVLKEDAIFHKRRYYHPRCFKTKNDIDKVMDMFPKYINKNVIYSQLRRTINDIVFNKKVDSGLLVFGLEYYIKHKLPLNYPGGLYYVIQNKDVEKAYKNYITKQYKNSNSFAIDQTNDNTFKYKPNKTKGFGDILK